MNGWSIIGLLGLGLGGLWFSKRARANVSSSSSSAPSSALVDDASLARELYAWKPPAAATPYLLTIDAAEGRHALPRGLLARVLYQESRFRPEVISGAVTSSAGAVGIAQLIPRYFPGVDPTNPEQSIEAAANYLAALHAQFGSWPLALAAYNWGPGNVSNHPSSVDWPAETRLYVAQITADIPEARA